MTDHYYYYEAIMGTGKKIHLFARDDIEAAYRAKIGRASCRERVS